jgi:hypothetical protein
VTDGSPYEYPSDMVLNVKKAEEEEWKRMIRELFEVPAGINIAQWSLWHENQHAMPRLLHSLVLSNIIP